MNLKITQNDNTGLKSQNKIINAYRKDWNLSRFKGNYATGKNFFSIHWEVSSSSPNLIRFHVESPTFKIDEKINSIKNEIIEIFLSKIDEINILLEEDKVNIGRMMGQNREINIREDSSSEVFHIELSKDITFDLKILKPKLIEIDKKLGNFIDDIFEPFKKKLKNFKPLDNE